MDLVGCQEANKSFNPILFSYNFCNEAFVIMRKVLVQYVFQ